MPSPKRILVAALALMAACAPKSPEAPVAAAPAAAPVASEEVVHGELGVAVDEYMRRLEVYGLSGALLVADHGEVVVHAGYGLANRETGAPLTIDTPLEIGSLGKQFTAAAIVRLEQDGELSVDDTLDRFFPDAPADKRGITLHQLMTHTAGMPYLPSSDFLAPAPRADVMAEMLALPLDARPGERHAYSNCGYVLLAGVIEAASGRSFEDYLRGALFEPAGMASTGFLGEARWAEGPAVHSYSGANDEGPLSAFPRMDKGVGAGTIVSTVADLHRWGTALRDDTVLGEPARAKLLAPYTDTPQPNVRYGYGWTHIQTPSSVVIGHAGDLGGYNTDFRWYVDRDLLVIFSSNARANGPGYRQAVMNNVSLLAAGQPYAEPPAVTAIAASALDPLAGTYELASGARVEVWADDEGLLLGADSQEAIALLAGADPTAAATADELNARALAVAEAAARGDWAPLRDNLHPSLPFAGMEPGLVEDKAAREARIGAFVRLEVLGTAVQSPMLAETWFRAVHENGESVGRFGWVGGAIAGIDVDLPKPMPTRFAPESATRAAAFDMFSGRTVRAEFVDGGLRIEGPSGTVEAKRVGG